MNRVSSGPGSGDFLITLFVAILGGIFFGSSVSAVEFTLARDIDFIEAEGFGPEGAPVQVGDRVVVTIRYDETESPVLLETNLAGLFGAFPFLFVELVDVPTVLSGFGGPSGGLRGESRSSTMIPSPGATPSRTASASVCSRQPGWSSRGWPLVTRRTC